MLAARETYLSSGRVSWGRLARWLALSSPLALLAGAVLYAAFRGGFYVPILIPLLARVLAGGAAWMTVSLGRCRNRWVGALVGLVAGLVASSAPTSSTWPTRPGSGACTASTCCRGTCSSG